MIRGILKAVFHWFDLFNKLMIFSDAQMSRSGDFSDDNDDTDKTNYFTPCACTWGNNVASQQRRGGTCPCASMLDPTVIACRLLKNTLAANLHKGRSIAIGT